MCVRPEEISTWNLNEKIFVSLTSYNWRFNDNTWRSKEWRNIARCCYRRIQITWLMMVMRIAISCLLLRLLLNIQCGMIMMTNIRNWRCCDCRRWHSSWVWFRLGHRGWAGMWACIATVRSVHSIWSLTLLLLLLLLVHLLMVMMAATINQLSLRVIIVCGWMIIVVEIVTSSSCCCSLKKTACIET